ncbi:MAG: efflux RND transporter periplasmic adaptor subunit [Vulcanimicrobiaceae bacterium]
MKRTRNLILIAIGLIAVIAVALISGRRSSDAVTVTTQTIKYSRFQTKLPENGVVQHPRTATIPTLVAGNLGSILVKPGDYVRAGQLLATIDNPTLESNAASSDADYRQSVATVNDARINSQNQHVQYDAAVATQRSTLQEARRLYDADVNLYKNKAIPRNQLDTNKAKLEQAQVAYDQAVQQQRIGAVTGYGQNSVQMAETAAQKAAIASRQAQQQLVFTHITAPFSGIIQSVATQPNDPVTPVRAGDPVTQGQALFTIAEDAQFIVRAQVDEQDVINVKIGQRANITGEDFPGRTLIGHVTSIAPAAIKSTDPSSTARQVLTTIRLESSPEFLKDGMTVDVDILTQDKPNAIVVPTNALVTEKAKKYVYVVRNGLARKTPVQTGSANDTQTIVTSGLRPGDVFIAESNPLLHDGSRVMPQASPSPKAT